MSKSSPSRPDITPAARAASSAVGLPNAPSWAGYWSFTTAAVILLFALYLAQKGRLSTWLAFFSWSNPATNETASTSGGSSAPAQTLSGLASGATGQGGLFAGGSTDPVAGPLSAAIKGIGGTLPGGFFGMGN